MLIAVLAGRRSCGYSSNRPGIPVFSAAEGQAAALERFRGGQINTAMRTFQHRFASGELLGRRVGVAFVAYVGRWRRSFGALVAPAALLALGELYAAPEQKPESDNRQPKYNTIHKPERALSITRHAVSIESRNSITRHQ